MIEMKCPGCGRALQFPIEYQGKSGKCKVCGSLFFIRAEASECDQVSEDHQHMHSTPLSPTSHRIYGLPPISTPTPVNIEHDIQDWQCEPASARQLSCLADLGATPSQMRGLTKGRASELIEELQGARPIRREAAVASDMAISQREMVKAQRDLAKAIRAQTSTHRSNCGCIALVLILLILSPLWLPFAPFVIAFFIGIVYGFFDALFNA